MTTLSNGTFLALGRIKEGNDFFIRAWVYNADGSLKAEQKLDIPDAGASVELRDLHFGAIDPMAVELSDGRIAITWTVARPSSSGTYIAPWTGIYDADLKPLGAPKAVFDPIQGARDFAESVAALDDGTLVISVRDEVDGHAYLRVFSPDGTRSTALDLGLAGSSEPGAVLSDVTALANGNVAVVVRGSTSSIKGYVITPSGTAGPAVLAPFSISTSTSPRKAAVKVTALEGGGFVVTWMEQGPNGTPDPNAFMRVYNSGGVAISDAKPVSSLALPDLLSAGHSDVLALPGGGFAIAYEKATASAAGVDRYEVHIAIFDKHGARLTDDLRVNQATTTESVSLQELHLTADGRIIVRHSQGIQIIDPRSEGASLKGTARNDDYIGTAFNDTFEGSAGADKLDGGLGIDYVSFAAVKAGVTASLSGGSGGDAAGDTYISIEGLLGSSFADVFTGNGSAILKGRSGDDTYFTKAGDMVEESTHEGRDMVVSNGSYALKTDAEIEVLKLSALSAKTSANLTGSNTANEIIGHGGKNTLRGLDGNDVLKASSGNDTLKGDAGSDRLHGGAGNDKLYGGTGTGKDVFVFDTKPNKTSNVDRIYDFNPKYDSIQLENKIFTKLGKGSTKGVKFKADMFVKSDAAKDKEDRIIYDSKTGALYYDQDGTGSKAQVKIATLSKNLKLTHHDFFAI